MSMIGGGYRVRELSSLSEYVAAMGEEHPKTAWNVGGVIELEPSENPLTRKELAKTLSTRLVSKRTAFRSRLCCAEKARLGVEHHYWMEDMGDAFDVFDVISKVDGDTIRPLYSDSASVTPVEALLENSVQQPFEKSLPPWRVFMVNERVEVAQRVLTRTSLIFNLHHVLGDGFTLMNALLDMTMPSVNGDTVPQAVSHWRPRSRPADMFSLRWLLSWICMLPFALLELTYGYFKSDPRNPFHPCGELRGDRQVRLCEPIPLDRVKAICESLHVTVNDFLIAIIAGASRKYLHRQANIPNEEISSLGLGLSFTVNLRTGSKMFSKRRNFSIMFGVPLPVAELHALDRIVAIQNATQRLKCSPLMIGAVLSYITMWACNWPLLRTLTITRLVGPKYASGKSWRLANVPGPKAERTFCGRRVTSLVGYTNNANGVVAVSYRNELRLTLFTDKAHISANVLRDYLEQEAATLLSLVPPP